MSNTINTGSKTLDEWCKKRPHLVESAHREDDGCFGKQDSYWVYLQPGYKCMRTDASMVHEGTVKDTLDALRDVVKTDSQI